MKSSIIANTMSSLTAKSDFLNNFENVVNRRVDIREDIKRYQATLSYASSEVDYSMGQNIHMLPSDMSLKIKAGTVRYNNKILVSDGKFSLGKNVEVNFLVLEPTSGEEHIIPMPKGHTRHKVVAHTHELAKKRTHEEKKITLILFLAGGFAIWNIFR